VRRCSNVHRPGRISGAPWCHSSATHLLRPPPHPALDRANTVTASDVILYGPGYSTYTRTARLALEEKGVSYRPVEVDFLRGAAKTPEHLSRHPFGKVPVLEHGDLRLYETAAITDYIDNAFSGPPLQPKDVRARALMLQVIGITVSYVYAPMVGQILVERLIKPVSVKRQTQRSWNQPCVDFVGG